MLLPVLAVLLTQVLLPPAPGVTRPRVLVVEDFNHPRLHCSRLEADWGALNEERTRLEFSADVRFGPAGYALKVGTRSGDGSPAGFWFAAAGPAADDRISLDLQPFDELQFRTRGNGTGSPEFRLRVELVGGRKEAGGAAPPASWNETITDSPEWKLHRVPLDPGRWTGTPAFSSLKSIRFLPENLVPGEFFIDQIEFVRSDRPSFDWASASDEALLDYIERHTYQYFERYSDPVTGHIFDRSCFPDVSSIAAGGFGLAGHAVAASRGWISREEGAGRVRRLLRSLASAGDRAARNGMFYHFIDSARSIPKEDSEVSIVDTALLMLGVHAARNYFSGDREIAELSDRLIRAVDWTWFFDPSRGLFHLAWSPVRRSGYACPDAAGGGYFSGDERNPVYWDVYTDEVALLSILAAASPTHAVPVTAFHSVDMTRRSYKGDLLSNSYNGSLFTYLFASCYLDTRSLGASSSGFDWYLNSRRAASANHRFAAEQRLSAWVFGISACEGPDGRYHNYGAPPSTVAPDFDGTVAIYGIVGSVLHRREQSLKAIRELFALNLFQEGGGFADAFNPLQGDPRSGLPWVNWTGFGIDQGAILLLVENARSGFAWKQVETDAVIDRTLTELFPNREKR